MHRKLLIVFASGLALALVCFGAAWGLVGDRIVRDARTHNGWNFSFDGDHVSGEDDGPRVRRPFAFDGSRTLELDVPADLHFRRGTEARMTIEGPKAVVEGLEFRDGRLALRPGAPKHYHDLTITIVAPQLSGLAIDAAADVTLDDLSQDALALTVSGAGDIDASGNVQRITLQSSGASDVDLRQVAARDATIRLAGVGDVDVAASGVVDVSISGAGNVTLHRKPTQLRSQISGIGSIDHAY